MKITKVHAVAFDKLQITTPGWKISIGARSKTAILLPPTKPGLGLDIDLAAIGLNE